MLTASAWSDALLLLMLLPFAGHTLGQVLRGRWLMFDPLNFFWVGVLVIYVMETSSRYDLYVAKYGESIVQDSLLWINVGLLFVILGYRIGVGTSLSGLLPNMPPRLSSRGLLAASGLLIIGGVAGWWLIVASAGSLQAWASVSRGGADWENLSGYATLLASLLATGVSLLVLHVEMHHRRVVLRVVAWTLLGLMLLFFLYLGSRSRTIATVLAGLLAWSLPRRRNPPILLLVPLFAMLLIVANFQANYRGHFRDWSFNVDEIDWEEAASIVLPRSISGASVAQSARNIHGTELDMTIAVVSLVPDKIPYAAGVEFLQLFSHSIPRAWWPEKRYPRSESWTPIHLAAGTSTHWVEYVEVPFVGGPSPGFAASWYYNGGALGLAIGGLLVGIFFRAIRGIYDRDPGNESAVVVYSLLVPLGFLEAVSHPFSWVYSAPLVIGPTAVLLYLSRSRGTRLPN